MDAISTSPNDFSFNDEPLDIALSRLTATMTRTISLVQRSSIPRPSHCSQHSAGQVAPGGRNVKLRFPTPACAEDCEEEDKEERQFGKITLGRRGHCITPSDELNLRNERLSMLLEDLTSVSVPKLCTLVLYIQPMTFTEHDIAVLESSLRKLRSDKFSLISFGPIVIQAYFKHLTCEVLGGSRLFRESSISDSSDKPGSSGLSEDWRAINQLDCSDCDNGKITPTAIKEWTEKCEEIRTMWTRVSEERLELELFEKLLTEKERSIQLQTVTLTRLQHDFTASRKAYEAQLRERYFQVLFLKSQAESLLQSHIYSEFSLNSQPKTDLTPEKRQHFEQQLDTIRSEIDTLDGGIDSELCILLQTAEEAFLLYLDNGDEAKLSVRIESLKNKLLANRINAALTRTQRKTDTINSAIEAMGMTPQLIRVKNTIKTSVLQRCATNPSSPMKKSNVISGGNDTRAGDRQIAGGFHTPLVRRSPISPGDTLFLTSQSSIREEISDLSFDDKEDDYQRAQFAVKSYEKRADTWRAVVTALKEKISQQKRNETHQKDAYLRLKAREKCLISLESSLKADKAKLRARERTVSEREDDLRALFSLKHYHSSDDLHRYMSKSSVKVQDQIHHIEIQMAEVVKVNQGMMAEKAALMEAKKDVEKEREDVGRDKERVRKERERLDVVEKGLIRLCGKMLEVHEVS